MKVIYQVWSSNLQLKLVKANFSFHTQNYHCATWICFYKCLPTVHQIGWIVQCVWTVSLHCDIKVLVLSLCKVGACLLGYHAHSWSDITQVVQGVCMSAGSVFCSRVKPVPVSVALKHILTSFQWSDVAIFWCFKSRLSCTALSPVTLLKQCCGISKKTISLKTAY